MPRKLRIEYPGATYYIISRGNYRQDLFTQRGSGEAFERAIFEAVGRCGWDIYASVIMSNHDHLALRTPEPNLVTGMRWLQSTFATRFSTSGMHAYRNHLALCEEGDPRKRDELLKRYCRGWFAGSAKAKKEMAKDLAEESPEVDWETADLADLRELNEARWEIIVREEMKSAGKSESDVDRDRKAAAWKMVIAKRLQEETTAGNPWVAHRLRMGSPNYVCNLIHA